ncbi:MAG: Ig-like domain-containing protein, partial [Bacteroidales bacterium]|nr:Ig-like domain-containing protein [Bacteroidales bacterium]
NKNVVWSSSDEAVATVTQTGRVEAIAPGTATITATAADGSGISASCEITVEEKEVSTTVKVKQINIITPDNKTMYWGYIEWDKLTYQLKAEVLPANATNKNVTWKSSDTKVITVNSDGLVTFVGEGSATVTATAADKSGVSSTMLFSLNERKTDKITLSSSTGVFTVLPNRTIKITAELTGNKKPVTNNKVTWSVPNNSVFKIISSDDTSCTIQGVAAGTQTLTVTARDLSGNIVCTATQKIETSSTKNPITSISWKPDQYGNYLRDVLINAGLEIDVYVNVSPSNADFSKLLWVIDDESIATVSYPTPSDKRHAVIKTKKKGSTKVQVIATDGSGVSTNKTLLSVVDI